MENKIECIKCKCKIKLTKSNECYELCKDCYDEFDTSEDAQQYIHAYHTMERNFLRVSDAQWQILGVPF